MDRCLSRGAGADRDEPALPGCDSADIAAVGRIVREAGTSFAAGMKVLEPSRRYGMYAVYAFCRMVDDIADGDAGVSDPVAALQEWKARIARLYDDQPQDALDRVLHAAIRSFGLRQADFDAVIEGMETDASGPVVAPDEAAFDLYCDRVASAVGRLSVRVFGDSSPDADIVAYHLGRALQITNILRDIAADAKLGRLYLPGPLLARFSVDPDPSKICIAAGLPGVSAILATRAKDHFRRAFEAMGRCSRRTMLPARLMGGRYLAVLLALEKRGWDMPLIPVKVSREQTMLGVVRTFLG
ncbi:presqualene diphosphate synthase HpnD [Acetobacter sp. AN02]|nr:presqualene diphosphate synthase HpnD [Acetobacter sp. AN02]MDG6094003.1 presqualene diphosphate synthase HpnD [Acetobacter sp. AN02]